MFTCSKILAVIDPSAKQQTSLNRAIFLAEKTGASVVALSSIYDKSFDMAAILTSDERYEMKQAMLEHESLNLDALLKELSTKVAITKRVKWQKKLHESVVETCQEESCDLIVKATKKHGVLASSIFTPSDWHILRNAPVDVLLVKDHDWTNNGQVLASIGVSAKDDEHISLSDKIADTASELAKLTGSTLHLANSYAGAPVHIAVEVPNFTPEVYNRSVQERHTKKLHDLAKTHNLENANMHVLEGLPEDVIPKLSNDLDTDLLVIGSVGRRGLSAALLGNTAEMIIDAVNCDTLIIKP
jgi:universal stress protein E